MSTASTAGASNTQAEIVVAGPDKQVTAVAQKDGAKTTKGGQTTDETLSNALKKAYYNMTNNPVVCVIFVIAIATMLADIMNVPGPIEALVVQFNRTYHDKTVSVITKQIAYLGLNLALVTVKNKTIIINLTLLWIPYIIKSSDKNLNATIVFNVVILVFSGLGYVEIFWMTQLWYLYTEFRSPRHKFIIMMIGGMMIIFNYLHDSTIQEKDLYNRFTTVNFENVHEVSLEAEKHLTEATKQYSPNVHSDHIVNTMKNSLNGDVNVPKGTVKRSVSDVRNSDKQPLEVKTEQLSPSSDLNVPLQRQQQEASVPAVNKDTSGTIKDDSNSSKTPTADKTLPSVPQSPRTRQNV